MNRLIGRVIGAKKSIGYVSNGFLSTAEAGILIGKRMMGPVEETIRQKLTEKLGPAHLDVVNESSMHNVPKGSETHFKVIVVADRFENVPLIQRHRLINDALKEELAAGVHALSIVAHTPSQWEERGGKVEKSPPCLGGSNR